MHNFQYYIKGIASSDHRNMRLYNNLIKITGSYFCNSNASFDWTEWGQDVTVITLKWLSVLSAGQKRGHSTHNTFR